MNENLIIIDVEYAYFGLIYDERGIIIKAPPIVKWTFNRNIDDVIKYYVINKKAKVINEHRINVFQKK